ncbi:MAG: ThiF family adenylyltransferase [Solirubrobacteraceae bacterium]
MAVPPEQFARVSGRLNISLLATKLVMIAGVGTVGSQIARELANGGVGRLRMVDGDVLEESNLVRHALTRQYLGTNKAEAMTLYLADEVPTLRAEALPRYIDSSLSDGGLDKLLVDADLIIAATDDRDAQRRIARRALALDIPAVVPALYGDNGGEVFVQRSSRNSCFFCWDGFRPTDERLRGVTALNADTLAVLQLAVHLSFGVLDRASVYAGLFAVSRDDPRPRQLFIQRRLAALEIAPMRRRSECPACGVGPAVGTPVASPPQPSPPRPTAPRPSTPPQSAHQPTPLPPAPSLSRQIIRALFPPPPSLVPPPSPPVPPPPPLMPFDDVWDWVVTLTVIIVVGIVLQLILESLSNSL